jgi:hypothetical protein
MAVLKTSIECTNTAVRYSDTGTGSLTWKGRTDEEFDFCVISGSGTTLYYATYFYAIPSTHSGRVYVDYDWAAESQSHSAESGTDNFSNLAEDVFLDGVTGHGSRLLSMANEFKDYFFDGVTQTEASLKAYLDDLYGEHKGYDGGEMYNFPWYRPFWNMSPVSGECGYGYYNPEGSGGLSVNMMEGFNFTGDYCYLDPKPDGVADNRYRLFLAADWIFNKPKSPEKLRFNVYVDGVIDGKGPNIQINWTNTNEASELSEALIKPHIWCWPVPQPESPEIIARPPVITVNDVKIPEDARLNYNQTFSWEDSMQTDYIGMASSLTSQYSTIDKVAYYGVDGVPDSLRFYLRFDYSGDVDGQILNTWGDLYYVDIPYVYQGAAYIEPVEVSDSQYNVVYDTEVIVIGGTPPEDIPDDPDEPEPGYNGDGDPSEDGRYPDPTYKPDLTDYDSEGYPGQAVLTRTYALTALELQNVGNKLWTQDYFDVLKVQANPIENIIACRWYPMALTGTNADIVIGDVDFDLNKPMISTTYKKTIGSFKYTGQMVDSNGKKVAPGYLAQSPYTTLKLHLPYVGTIQLDASEIFDASLSIQYVVDIVSGDLIVFLRLDGQPYMNVSGKMGVDIPLSGTDRAQVQIANASRAVSAMAGAAGASMLGNTGKAANELLGGAMSIMGSDYTTQRVCTHSSVCASYENRAVVMEVIAPKTYISDGFKSIHGFPSHQYMKPYKGMGFIKTTPTTVVNVAMTDTENQELSRILASGCYF